MWVELELDEESKDTHVLGELYRTSIIILNDDTCVSFASSVGTKQCWH